MYFQTRETMINIFFVFYLIKSGGLPSTFKTFHPEKWRFQAFVEAISEEIRFWYIVQGVNGLKPFLSLFVRSNRQNGLIEGCLIQRQNNQDILLGLITHVQNLFYRLSLLYLISLLLCLCPFLLFCKNIINPSQRLIYDFPFLLIWSFHPKIF